MCQSKVWIVLDPFWVQMGTWGPSLRLNTLWPLLKQLRLNEFIFGLCVVIPVLGNLFFFKFFMGV